MKNPTTKNPNKGRANPKRQRALEAQDSMNEIFSKNSRQ